MPTYILTASVPLGNRLRNFFDKHSDSVAHILESPPTLRYSGFDTMTGGQVKQVGTDHYEARQGDRKLLQLFQDGTLIFRVPADPSFLAWAVDEEAFARWPRLNPVAVVEMHTSFVRLYAAILPRLVTEPISVRFTLNLKDARVGSRFLSLTEYYKLGIENVDNPRLFQTYNAEVTQTIDIAASLVIDSPDEAAYILLERFYQMFDMEPKYIPFVKSEGAAKLIDVNALKKL